MSLGRRLQLGMYRHIVLGNSELIFCLEIRVTAMHHTQVSVGGTNLQVGTPQHNVMVGYTTTNPSIFRETPNLFLSMQFTFHCISLYHSTLLYRYMSDLTNSKLCERL